jgi:release factor glutamine methyltransferase
MPPDPQNPDIRALIDEKYDGSTENKSALRGDLNRLAIGEPLAYVIGFQPFMGLKIFLDSHPLIPRPETEWWAGELVQAIRHRLPERPALPHNLHQLRLLDLCSGSGAIGCAVLKEIPDAHVSFGELMPEHKATIEKNIRENSLDVSRADVLVGDLFAPFADEKFDIIATNPPYIPDGAPLDASVERFEPREALRAGPDGLSLIKRIAEGAPQYLNEGGELWLECDITHADAALALISAHAKRAELRNDHYGRPRLIVGYY